jgi:hypothetical protein
MALIWSIAARLKMTVSSMEPLPSGLTAIRVVASKHEFIKRHPKRKKYPIAEFFFN